MAQAPHQQSHRDPTANSGRVSLRQKLIGLLPPMWRGNQSDMPLVTHNRIWFLRESRFLFFTRNGPIEITLQPSMVVATVLVGMVGVSVIFLSTIFASYSAFEVMRDESIQTAEASIAPSTQTNPDLQDAANAQPTTWQSEITGQNAASDRGALITGKKATTPKPIITRFNTQPTVSVPSPTELLTHSAPRLTVPADSADQAPQAPLGSGGAIASGPALNVMTPNDMAPNDTAPNDTAPNEIISADPAKTAKATLDPMPAPLADAGENVADQPVMAAINSDAAPSLPNENRIEADSIAEEPPSSFAETAAGFAIAMLPRFLTTPEPIDEIADAPAKAEKTSPEDDRLADVIAGSALDDGFAKTAYGGRKGPLFPSVSEAARAQKMLLSLDSEISYIRESITKLGISTDNLPHYDDAHLAAGDTDFKELMITLAKHRAALRKIPFKPPMLYFYISSDYGYRKHPKTGKKTFHHGIDLAGTWQENVRATAPGTVVFAGREGSFGKVVRVEHDYGVSTLYAHLARITVTVGDYVGENAIIGKMGNTGKSAGPHLHYEIQVNGKSVDPSDFFTIGRQMSVAGELRRTALTDWNQLGPPPH